MKRLNGIAHDLGHHAISGLCGVVPYIYRAGESKARYNIEVPIYPFAHPSCLPHNYLLDLGLEGLRIFFSELLTKHGFSHKDVISASLYFEFLRDCPNAPVVHRFLEITPRPYERDPIYRCTSTIITRTNRKYSHIYTHMFFYEN